MVGQSEYPEMATTAYTNPNLFPMTPKLTTVKMNLPPQRKFSTLRQTQDFDNKGEI